MAPITEGMTAEDVARLTDRAMELSIISGEHRKLTDDEEQEMQETLRILATYAALAEKTAEVERLDKALQQMGDRLDREIPALRAQLAEAQADSARWKAVRSARLATYTDEYHQWDQLSPTEMDEYADSRIRLAARQPDPAPGETE